MDCELAPALAGVILLNVSLLGLGNGQLHLVSKYLRNSLERPAGQAHATAKDGALSWPVMDSLEPQGSAR